MAAGRWTGFRPAEISARINKPVVSIHAEDAAFLWLLRDRAACAPNYSLTDLAALDERMEAHLDGVRVAGAAGWELAERQLEKGPGEAFEAAVLCAGADDARFARVTALAEESAEVERAIVSALGWLEIDRAAKRIASLLQGASPLERRIGLGGAVAHRRDPGQSLGEATRDPEPRLRARAVRALGELGAAALADRAVGALGDSDPDVAFWAAWSSAVLGDRGRDVLARLSDAAGSQSAHAERAVQILALCLDDAGASDWLSALQRGSDPRLFAIAASARGDSAHIPALLDLMRHEPHSRVAGEAFAAITGIDLERSDLSHTGDEEPVEPPASDDALAVPDPERVAKWWEEHARELPPGRCLLGKALSHSALSAALRIGNQRVRASAALELALRNPGTPIYETRAPGRRQLAELEP